MVGLEINAPKVRNIDTSRKKVIIVGERQGNLFLILSNVNHVKLCAVSLGSIHLIFICSFRKSSSIKFCIVIIF